MADVDSWDVIGDSTLSRVSNTNRAKVYAHPPKLENIIVIGSEMHYNSFWWKMMFISPATHFVRHSSFRKSDRVTIAYVDVEYTRTEKLAIEGMKRDIHYSCNDVNFVRITSTNDLINLLNRDRERYKIQDLVFFCHGLNSVLTLNLDGKLNIDFKIEHIANIKQTAFSANAKFYSYACRTGIGPSVSLRLKDTYKSLSEAEPEKSLAQKIADYFDIEVHAFYTRTDYANTIRPTNDSNKIVTSLKEQKETFPKNSILTLVPPYEAFKHDGLGGGIPFISGASREGTKDYALWRKGGAQSLPVAATSPKGLPSGMVIFNKSKG